MAALAALATAQQNYQIAPDSVSDDLKDYWCSQQKTQCPLICLQTAPGVPRSNDCTASDLTYACVCSDGLSPNLTQYSQTLPYFICTEWGTQCVSNCGTNSACADDCRADHPCGAQDPVRANATLASASASAAAAASSSASAGGEVHTGFAGEEGGDAEQQDNGAIGAGLGWAVLVGGLTLGFAVVL